MQEEEKSGGSTNSNASSSLSTTLGGVGNGHLGHGGKVLHEQPTPSARGGQSQQVRIRLPTTDQRRQERGQDKLLGLLLMFGIPRSIRSDPGTDFAAGIVQHLFRWLNEPIDFVLVDDARVQGAVEMGGGGGGS